MATPAQLALADVQQAISLGTHLGRKKPSQAVLELLKKMANRKKKCKQAILIVRLLCLGQLNRHAL